MQENQLPILCDVLRKAQRVDADPALGEAAQGHTWTNTQAALNRC